MSHRTLWVSHVQSMLVDPTSDSGNSEILAASRCGVNAFFFPTFAELRERSSVSGAGAMLEQGSAKSAVTYGRNKTGWLKLKAQTW